VKSIFLKVGRILSLIKLKKLVKKFGVLFIFILLLVPMVNSGYSQIEKATRPGYVYDNGDIISTQQEARLDSFLRKLDSSTSIEIIIWTTDSFYGHGIKKDDHEINERDTLANYIFNEVSLDGIKGIGKAGKDNGLLILLSKESDSSGGSMRIEVGRGLEGQITDGTAGQILDMYLVPARNSYLENNDTVVFDNAFMNTVLIIAQKLGYSEEGNVISNPNFIQSEESDIDKIIPFLPFIILFVILFVLSQKKRKGRSFGFIGGGFGGGSGGGFGGGGGGSGGGGAGRYIK